MRNHFLPVLFLLLVMQFAVTAQNIVVDASEKHQTIIGLGVNANPQSWATAPDSLKQVIDQLVDSMGCTSFRLMFDDCDWEPVNDNDDPEVYNWSFYDSVYASPRFAGIWDMIRYLNQKGITDITLSPDGAAPGWMGVTKLKSGLEAEYAEMMSSMVFYAKKRLSPGLSFNELSPINESSCGGGEGVVTTKAQFSLIYRLIASHLNKDQVPELFITGPDDCDGWRENFEAMSESPETMSRIRYFGQHDYGNDTKKATALLDAVKKSAYPDRPVIMSEVNAVCTDCDGGVYNKDYGFTAYAKPAYQFILQDLNAGVAGVQVWEAYDSRYHHPNRTLTWSMWGIFAINDTNQPGTYTQRPHFNLLKHLYRFVKPGYRRVGLTSTLPDLVISAFTDSLDKKLVITGVNNSARSQTLSILVRHDPVQKPFSYYQSDASRVFRRGSEVRKKNNLFSVTIPADAIFTLSRE